MRPLSLLLRSEVCRSFPCGGGRGRGKRTSNVVVDRLPCHPHSLPLFLFCLLLILFRRRPKAGRRKRREKGEEVGKKKGERGEGEPEGRRKKRVNFSSPPFFRPPAHGGSRERRKGGGDMDIEQCPIHSFPFPSRAGGSRLLEKRGMGQKRKEQGHPCM